MREEGFKMLDEICQATGDRKARKVGKKRFITSSWGLTKNHSFLDILEDVRNGKDLNLLERDLH